MPFDANHLLALLRERLPDTVPLQLPPPFLSGEVTGSNGKTVALCQPVCQLIG